MRIFLIYILFLTNSFYSQQEDKVKGHFFIEGILGASYILAPNYSFGIYPFQVTRKSVLGANYGVEVGYQKNKWMVSVSERLLNSKMKFNSVLYDAYDNKYTNEIKYRSTISLSSLKISRAFYLGSTDRWLEAGFGVTTSVTFNNSTEYQISENDGRPQDISKIDVQQYNLGFNRVSPLLSVLGFKKYGNHILGVGLTYDEFTVNYTVDYFTPKKYSFSFVDSSPFFKAIGLSLRYKYKIGRNDK